MSGGGGSCNNAVLYNHKENYHIQQTIKKANKRLYHLREVRKAGLLREVGLTTYCTKQIPLTEYASSVWGGMPKYLSDDLQNLQTRCFDIIGVDRTTLLVVVVQPLPRHNARGT